MAGAKYQRVRKNGLELVRIADGKPVEPGQIIMRWKVLSWHYGCLGAYCVERVPKGVKPRQRIFTHRDLRSELGIEFRRV